MVRRLILNGLLLWLYSTPLGAVPDFELIHVRGDTELDWQVAVIASEGPLYQHGQWLVLVQIDSHSRVLNLQTKPVQRDRVISHLIPLRSQQLGERSYRHTLGWTIHPLEAGELSIALPDIEYLRGGNINYRLHLAPIQLKVLPLPVYLPQHIPVGRIQMSLIDPPHWLRQGSDVVLQLEVESHGIADAILRPAQPDLFRGREGVLPAQLQAITTQVDGNGLHTRYHYWLPIQLDEWGIVHGQQELQWFDPQTGTLHSEHYSTPWIWVVADWQTIFLVLLFFFLLAVSGPRLLRQLRGEWQRYRGYRRLLVQLELLNSREQLHEAMTTLAWAEGMARPRSVSDCFAITGGGDCATLVTTINAALYHNGLLSDARDQFQQWCDSRLRGWRRIYRWAV